jgi:transposase
LKPKPSKAELEKLVQSLQQQLTDRETEIKLLRQKIDQLSRRIFGKSSEQLDPGQLEFLLRMENLPPGKSEASLSLEETKEAGSAKKQVRKPRAERIPEHLPVVEEVIDPIEVTAAPENYRCIGQEVSEQLDFEPARFLRRRIVRRKYVRKAVLDTAPIIAPLPPVLQERCLAAPGLFAQVIVAKYCDHLPLYRQESIYRARHGIDLSRQTMARWIDLVADWLQPIYDLIRSGVMGGGYVQVDETPIRYLEPGHGCAKHGYLWTSCRPGGDVFYHWETSRGSQCLSKIIPANFRGTLQTDGYAAYAKFARESQGRIDLAGCWAHARRKFHEAREQAPQMVGFIIRQMQLLYRIEKKLRLSGAGSNMRASARAAQSRPIYNRLGKLLTRLQQQKRYLPASLLGKAISYALSNWDLLSTYLSDGRVEIDNNQVENAIRPTAIGKKNWLFIGEAGAGQRSAVIYTVIENCRRYQIDPYAYLRDVLTRLPSMTNWQVKTLHPKAWRDARIPIAQSQAA